MANNQFRAARKKFHYIYVTTCRVTGRYYIGMHSTDNLDDGYIGSGKRLWSSIKKHGAEQHVCKILEFCPSRTELRRREAEHVNEERLKLDPYCMNLAIGGEGGWEHINNNVTILQRRNVKSAAKFCEKYKQDQEFAKKFFTAETRALGYAKLRELQKGVFDSTIREKGCIAALSKTSITKRKQTFAKNKHQQGEKNSRYGSCWIYNGTISKSIAKSELDYWLTAGWKQGRKMKTDRKH